jgi:predicted transposase YbfD/YdcC
MEQLKQYAQGISDPRRIYGNVRHLLIDILVIGLISMLCGGKDFTDMEVFGKAKENWLRRFLDLPNGIPDSDTFRRVFERLNPNELSKCLNSWIMSEREAIAVKTVSLDGKTIRGSGNDSHSAYHVVSAWAGEHGITLGQVFIEEKSNEITAVPQLLDLIDIKGAIVTIDAMGCQKNIAALIISKEADYLFTLKGNHKNLHKQVKGLFESIDSGVADICLDVCEQDINNHGRIEKRIVDVISADLISIRSDWHNLQSIVRIRYTSICTKSGRETSQTRYFITSLPPSARRLSAVIKSHWSIENNLHWTLDVIFEEDKSKAKKDNSPLNLNILRKIALSIILPLKKGRMSLKKMMFRAALELDYLNMVLFGL